MSKDRINNQQNRLNFGDDATIGRDIIGGDRVTNYNYTKILEISEEKITSRELIITSPYRGLKRFNFSDRHLFFGRDCLIQRLLEVVNHNSLSLVLGASGSGKSSLIRAGLIPELKHSLSSQTFYNFVFTPDRDPFDSLYHCLRAEEKNYSFTISEAEIALERKADTLTEVISTLRKEGQHWLIFVDQFEELFTICNDSEKRKNFIAGLVEIAKSDNSFVKIVLAMRVDFLEQLSSYPDLGEIINQNNLHLVTDMHSDELRLAIEQPAARHGVVFEEGLVEQIIGEVEARKGYLPLLQYTLNLLWESECQTLDANGKPHIEDQTLNKSTYAALEGVRGALQKYGNKIYRDLNRDQQSMTKQIFVKLINIVDTDSGSKAVSRRAYRNEFTGELVESTLNKFIEANLLVSSYEYSSSELTLPDNDQKQLATVEIAHEILLSSWDTFKRWIEEEKEAIILKNWLADETKRWQKIRSKDEIKAREELLKGSRLDRVVEFRNKNAFKNLGGLSTKEIEFIDASVKETERVEQEKEQQRQRELEHEKKARQAAQKTTIMALVAAPVVTGLLILTGINHRATQIEKIRNSSESAKTLVASNQALDTLLESLEAATKLKQFKFIQPPSELRKELSQTIQQALVEDIKEYNRIEGDTGDITSVHFSSNNKMIATASKDGTVKLWNLDEKKLQTLPHDEEVARVIFSPDEGQTIATVITEANERTSKMIVLWNQDGKQIKTLPYDGYPENVNFSPDGQMIAAISDNDNIILMSKDGEELKPIENESFVGDISFSQNSTIIAIASNKNVKLWNTETKKLKTLPHRSVSQVNFSRDGQKIVTGGYDGNVKLWSIDGKLLETLPHDAAVYKVNFSRDGQKIVTQDAKDFVRLWNHDGGEPKILDHSGIAVSIVRFSPDDETIATVGKDKIVKLWNYQGQILETLTGHQSAINSISFSPDGKTVASASTDKTVKLWSIDGQELQTIQHDYRVNNVSFSSDSRNIISVSQDNSVRFWNLDTLQFQTLQEHQEPVNLVRFSPDGETIATASWDTNVQLWSRDGQKLELLDIHRHWIYDISFSPDGEMIATGGHEGIIGLWNRDGELVRPIGEVNFDALGSLSFSLDGQTLAVGRFDGDVEIWSLEGEKLKNFSGHTGIVNSISFSFDGKTIASASRDRTVKIWQVDNQTLIATLKHDDSVISVGFSADDQTITSVSRDGVIKLWNLDGEELKSTRYNTLFESASFNPNGKIIATTSGDNTVQLWTHEGIELESLRGHKDGIMSVSFSPEGKTLASASHDNSVILWNLNFERWESVLNQDLDALIVEACDVVDDYLENQPQPDRNICDRPPSSTTAKAKQQTDLVARPK